MNGLSEVLYAVSNALLLPVMAGILFLFIASLALLGGLVRELPERLRWRRERRRILATVRAGRQRLAELGPGLRHFPRRGILGSPAASHEVLLAALKEDCRRSLALSSFGSRAGPALGLMGTLIPLGPALVGLAQGDLQTLADRLVVAFTTTVVGMLVGLMCFATGQVRARWFADDLLWLEACSGATSQAAEGNHEH